VLILPFRQPGCLFHEEALRLCAAASRRVCLCRSDVHGNTTRRYQLVQRSACRNYLIIPGEPRFGALGEAQQGRKRRFQRRSCHPGQSSPGVPKRFIRRFLERLSGTSLGGSDRTPFSGAKRRKGAHSPRSAGSCDPITEPIRSFQTVSPEGVFSKVGLPLNGILRSLAQKWPSGTCACYLVLGTVAALCSAEGLVSYRAPDFRTPRKRCAVRLMRPSEEARSIAGRSAGRVFSLWACPPSPYRPRGRPRWASGAAFALPRSNSPRPFLTLGHAEEAADFLSLSPTAFRKSASPCPDARSTSARSIGT